ncbi:hypothetical protein O6H91_06G123700 [Diphasiastrum complanatum]|uniref:Uncharacterized protein n=1 Tax=Diphasiastrum complanatum TaxID=34168 RepID=A0ACC2DIR7_DIPCM|nr:hypothetical protein O6H91_06G123700 [Diphasiastrum complanatum]
MEVSTLSKELPDSIADFKLYGVFKEATRLLQKHSVLLLSLTGVFYAPYILLNLLILFSLRPSTTSIIQELFAGDFTALANLLADHYSIPAPQFILLVLICRLLSIALTLYLITAIAYSIGSIYSTGEPSFICVLDQLPKLWPKVAITFLWSASILLIFEVASSLIIGFIYNLLKDLGVASAAYFAAYLLSIVVSCILYVSVIWLLATVIPALEETCGRDALVRSSALIVGKKCVALAFIIIFEILGIVAGAVLQAWIISCEFEYLIVKVFVLFVLVLSGGVVVLYANVMVTVLYFSSKAYHSQCSSAFIEGYSLLSLP